MLPPHVFSVMARAYRGMLVDGKPQSVLISGESGAGKTEATKLGMAALAMLSGSVGTFTQAALESGILLESFGNAKTVRNDNSSRFGKWCVVGFNTSGKIGHCRLEAYLLEKSRVVACGPEERNYHIFYQLIAAGANLPPELKLGSSAATHTYLSHGLVTLPGIDDDVEFEHTVEMMEATQHACERLSASRPSPRLPEGPCP